MKNIVISEMLGSPNDSMGTNPIKVCGKSRRILLLWDMEAFQAGLNVSGFQLVLHGRI